MKKTKYYKNTYLRIDTNDGRKRILSYLKKSNKFEKLSPLQQVKINRALNLFKTLKNAPKEDKKFVRNKIKDLVYDVFDYDGSKQGDWSAGRIKSVGGRPGVSNEVLSYKYENDEFDLPDSNSISDLETFKLFYSSKMSDLYMVEVMRNFDAFVGDTDSGWTRRTMNKLGITDDVSRGEFYEWLEEVRR